MSIRRILVVDDERLARISLADFLQEAGYETEVASDGESAIRLQQKQPFDVCIVDIRLPGIDGVETILSLHRIEPQTRFIVYTGSPQFALSPALKKIGLSRNYVVRKPVFDMTVFVRLIASEMQGGFDGN